MKQWFVVHTQPSKEWVAKKHLADQGFESYLPIFKKSRRHARKADEVLAPFFPRYLFVVIDLEIDQWRKIQGTRGVSYLLQANNQPAMIPSQIVQDLKNQEDAHGVLMINDLSKFTQGDKVRVVEGAFKDSFAVFKQMDGRQRVQLLLSFLGREVNITLPRHVVEAA